MPPAKSQLRVAGSKWSQHRCCRCWSVNADACSSLAPLMLAWCIRRFSPDALRLRLRRKLPRRDLAGIRSMHLRRCCKL
eukprot:6292958-Alexandrium_andersonii.AAC.1